MDDFCDDIVKDPYEFPENDVNLWLKLLIKAKETETELFFILVYLRGVGVRLVPDVKFGYFIKPIIDPNGVKGWLNQKQYDKEKVYLKPYKEILSKLLREL